MLGIFSGHISSVKFERQRSVGHVKPEVAKSTLIVFPTTVGLGQCGVTDLFDDIPQGVRSETISQSVHLAVTASTRTSSRESSPSGTTAISSIWPLSPSPSNDTVTAVILDTESVSKMILRFCAEASLHALSWRSNRSACSAKLRSKFSVMASSLSCSGTGTYPHSLSEMKRAGR